MMTRSLMIASEMTLPISFEIEPNALGVDFCIAPGGFNS
jgi:hypothetical protein